MFFPHSCCQHSELNLEVFEDYAFLLVLFECPLLLRYVSKTSTLKLQGDKILFSSPIFLLYLVSFLSSLPSTHLPLLSFFHRFSRVSPLLSTFLLFTHLPFPLIPPVSHSSLVSHSPHSSLICLFSYFLPPIFLAQPEQARHNARVPVAFVAANAGVSTSRR